MSRKVEDLVRRYTDWHWGSAPTKLVHVKDAMVPDVVGIGRLKSIELKGGTVINFPAGSWIAYDPEHPCERIHIILPAAEREANRKRMKTVTDLMPLQDIAEITAGDHARQPMPRIQAHLFGLVHAVIYFTHKAGEEGNAWFDYKHEFGHEGRRGIVPALACDVSGRLWLCGGSYRCPLPGITG